LGYPPQRLEAKHPDCNPVAENHYTADYPEDEVASDDEYDQDPYRFRNGNASDNEEYGSDDNAYSVDGDEDEDAEFARRVLGRPRMPTSF